jgi:integrase
VGTIFTGKNPISPSTESKLNQFHPDGDLNGPFKGLPKKRHRLAPSGMELPETVSYRNLRARITHSAKDGLYHAYWNCGGHRGKAASKKFERAKEKALAALKLIHKGHADIASLNNQELRRLMAARDLLRDAGIENPLQVATEYIAFRQAAPEADLLEVTRHWNNGHANIEKVGFGRAGLDWFETNRGRWKDTTHYAHKRRMAKLVEAFQCDVCDLGFEPVRFFLQTALGGKSAKTRNHFRETLRGIIKHCVARSWLSKNHGLESLLKPEKVISAPPQIISPDTFRIMLQTANAELRPVVALLGFCGIRFSEAARLSWDNVFEIEGYIQLNAHRTKTAQRRLVPRFESLELWLSPYKGRTGPVWNRSKHALDSALGKLRREVGVTGLHNCLRHSYASYRLATTSNVNQLADEMGNSREIIYRNYRQLVTPANGHQWFAVIPGGTQSNVIAAV